MISMSQMRKWVSEQEQEQQDSWATLPEASPDNPPQEASLSCDVQ